MGRPAATIRFVAPKKQQPIFPKPVCVYCQGRADTRDHVWPEALFGDPLPLNMITRPACATCNAAKKNLDEYVRDWIASDARLHGHPIVRDQLFDKALRAIDRNQSWLPMMIREVLPDPVNIVTESGIFLEQARSMRLDGRPVAWWFRYIVQGLTNYHFRDHLPADFSHLVTFPDRETFGAHIDTLRALGGFHGFFILGDDVARWAVQGSSATSAIWMFVLFGRIPVTVFAWPPEGLQILRDRAAAMPD